METANEIFYEGILMGIIIGLSLAWMTTFIPTEDTLIDISEACATMGLNTTKNTSCTVVPNGRVVMKPGARFENVELYNLTIEVADDNYSMRYAYGKNWHMIVNGSQIR